MNGLVDVDGKTQFYPKNIFYITDSDVFSGCWPSSLCWELLIAVIDSFVKRAKNAAKPCLLPNCKI